MSLVWILRSRKLQQLQSLGLDTARDQQGAGPQESGMTDGAQTTKREDGRLRSYLHGMLAIRHV